MKSILEQNFNELYTKVKERVKCIDPIKQIDMFTKMMMWTSLNEILMDVFGNTRFMWMIDTTDSTFVVKFIDKYKIEQTKELNVPYAIKFVWPTEHELLHMSFQQLEQFYKKCSEYNIHHTDINNHYGYSHGWFDAIKGRRKNNAAPRSSDVNKRLISVIKSSKWKDNELDAHLLLVALKNFNIPFSIRVVETIFTNISVKALEATFYRLNSDIHMAWKDRYEERYGVILDKLLQYITSAIEYIHNTKGAFKNLRNLNINTTGKDKKEVLIQFFEDKKIAIEIAKRDFLVNQKFIINKGDKND